MVVLLIPAGNYMKSGVSATGFSFPLIRPKRLVVFTTRLITRIWEAVPLGGSPPSGRDL